MHCGIHYPYCALYTQKMCILCTEYIINILFLHSMNRISEWFSKHSHSKPGTNSSSITKPDVHAPGEVASAQKDDLDNFATQITMN